MFNALIFFFFVFLFLFLFWGFLFLFRRKKCFVFFYETKKNVLWTKGRKPFFSFFVMFCFAKKKSVESLREICKERKRIERKKRKTKKNKEERKKEEKKEKKKKKKTFFCLVLFWNPSKKNFHCVLISFVKLFVLFVSFVSFFFLWVCFLENVVQVFAVLSFGFWSSKRQNSRIDDFICSKERTHFWKIFLFAVRRFDVKWRWSGLFVCLVCDHPNKKKQPRFNGFILHQNSISIWKLLICVW